VVGSRLAFVFVISVFWAAAAEAQRPLYTAMLTPHIGAASGGDVRTTAITPGVSIGVIDVSGIGAELDLSHARAFDDDHFAESGVTSLMVNGVGMYPHASWRPFAVVGAGLLRVRGSQSNGQTLANKTDWGFNAGGGLLYVVNDTVGIRGDVRYFRYVQRDDELPLTDNGFFDFWRISVGVTLQWAQH
jgi:opacity protein-like surface antigen